MKTERFEFRMSKKDKSLIQRAAKRAGESVANFVLLASVVDAHATLAGLPRERITQRLP